MLPENLMEQVQLYDPEPVEGVTQCTRWVPADLHGLYHLALDHVFYRWPNVPSRERRQLATVVSAGWIKLYGNVFRTCRHSQRWDAFVASAMKCKRLLSFEALLQPAIFFKCQELNVNWTEGRTKLVSAPGVFSFIVRQFECIETIMLLSLLRRLLISVRRKSMCDWNRKRTGIIHPHNAITLWCPCCSAYQDKCGNEKGPSVQSKRDRAFPLWTNRAEQNKMKPYTMVWTFPTSAYGVDLMGSADGRLSGIWLCNEDH